jgi:hypothetical protein
MCYGESVEIALVVIVKAFVLEAFHRLTGKGREASTPSPPRPQSERAG